MKRKYLILFILALSLFTVTAYGDSIKGYTNIGNIFIYENTDYSSSQVTALELGCKVEVLEYKDEWCRVRTSDGSTGWIEGYFITVPPVKYVKNVSGYNVNIRKGPATTTESVGQMLPDEKLKYIDTYHSWHIVAYNGGEYYVASWLAELEADGSEKAYLLYDGINIRDDMSVSGNIIYEGGKYESFPVLKEQNGWLKVRLENGQIGYVAGWLTSYGINYFSEGPSGYKKTIDSLNLRSGPSVNDEKIKILEQNTSIKIISSENGWDKVVTQSGHIGWCSNDYLTDVLPLSGRKVLLDPGHGGKDPGSISQSGRYEKHVNLEVAFKLKERLEALGAAVYMTRSDDTYINNIARGRMADSLGADILLSIHHNSLVKSDYYGLSTYYNTINYKNPRYGYKLAEAIYLNAITINGVYRDGILDRNYQVLRETNTPAALIEIGFMSNPLEEMNIHNSSFQNQMVRKIADGIIDYFNE